MGLDAMILVFWMFSVKPTFSLSCFTSIKRLFSSSLLSAIRVLSLSVIRVVSSAYLRLLIFLPAILIPACASSSPAFHIMYSAYKLNKQSDNIQPWCTPFPIWNQSVVPCPVPCPATVHVCYFLTCIQVSQVAGQVVWYSHLLKNFPQFVVIHMVRGFSVVSEEGVFLKFPSFFHDPADAGNLISSFFAFYKSSVYIEFLGSCNVKA